MFSTTEFFSVFAEIAVVNGYLVSLTLICVMQYLLHSERLRKLRVQMARDNRELLRLQREVTDLQKDQAQTRFENQIFEDFISQPNHDSAMTLLLSRFVPRPRHGFGAWLERRGKAFVWCQTRGLSTAELTSISHNGDWIKEFDHRDFQIYDEESFRHSFLYNYLPAADRKRCQQIFVFAVRHRQEITGLFITTSIYPAGMALERRISLALRLLNGLESHFHHTEELLTQRTQLKTTQEMLQLRDVTDLHRSSVKTLVEAFLECLHRQSNSDRVLLAFAKENRPTEIRSLQRVGLRADEQDRDAWERDEAHLIKIGQHRRAVVILDPQELDLHGFDGPLRHVALIPVIPKDGTYGVLCVIRHGANTPYTEVELKHLRWAAEYLGETLRRSLDQATIEMHAKSDPLTGLMNRRAFDERLNRNLSNAERRDRDCALLLLDIDRFKSINDTFGHIAGDIILRRVAETVRNTLGHALVPKAIAARFGGEEFAIILPGTGQALAQVVADQIRVAISNIREEFKGLECPVTASLGIAVFPHQADEPLKLIEAADTALYHAKNTGRNRAVCLAHDSDAMIG